MSVKKSKKHSDNVGIEVDGMMTALMFVKKYYGLTNKEFKDLQVNFYLDKLSNKL